MEVQRSSPKAVEFKGDYVTATDFLYIVTKRGGLIDSIKRTLDAVKHIEIRVQMDDATPYTGRAKSCWSERWLEYSV